MSWWALWMVFLSLLILVVVFSCLAVLLVFVVCLWDCCSVDDCRNRCVSIFLITIIKQCCVQLCWWSLQCLLELCVLANWLKYQWSCEMNVMSEKRREYMIWPWVIMMEKNKNVIIQNIIHLSINLSFIHSFIDINRIDKNRIKWNRFNRRDGL